VGIGEGVSVVVGEAVTLGEGEGSAVLVRVADGVNEGVGDTGVASQPARENPIDKEMTVSNRFIRVSST